MSRRTPLAALRREPPRRHAAPSARPRAQARPGPVARPARPRPLTAGLGLALALAPAVSGCAFESGEAFATLHPTLSAAWDSTGGRDAGDGWLRLATDFQFRPERTQLHVGAIELFASAGGASTGAATFDPANPPAGYSLCHGGHCHRDDGALVDYADIETELAGGGTRGAAVAAVTLPVGTLAPLGAPGAVVSPVSLECEPSCALGLGTLTRAQAVRVSLSLVGRVRDARATARLEGEREVVVETTLGAVPRAELDVAADRTHPPHVELSLALGLSPRLLDAVAWDTLAAALGGGTLRLVAAGTEGAADTAAESADAADTADTADTTGAGSPGAAERAAALEALAAAPDALSLTADVARHD